MARLSEDASSGKRTIQFGKNTLPKGARVEVSMKDGSIFTGQAVLYDSSINWFVLVEEKDHYYEKLLINYEHVDQVCGLSAVSEAPELIGNDEELMHKAEQRLQKALAEKKYFCSDQASQRAVQTFMELKKILNSVEWANNDILVMDVVRISPPYRPDSCEMITKSRQAEDCLNRVKKILVQVIECIGSQD
ncbi:unnamed protein product [Bursaphelenchus xylophilus]|uniref:(pine wood nematode) hypothetical protein n=1 Tax=Bursaphelenchus xylophilus TaxID=6326 RepID=A0A1I7SD71_BURXY|nr:unnamed protein product [Bursaphelenchus xylophilus]CAG9130523.1 unnamed protein product [Bursaphelenchus xylophilus]